VERIDPLRPTESGAAQVPAIRRLTLDEREEAARERERHRRERARKAPAPPGEPAPPDESGVRHVDFRA
jgi:hypothetical protein